MGALMSDNTFQAALDLVLEHEGGYVNDPSDRGGETKYGISKRAFPDLDIRNLTREDAARIYKAKYWDAGRFGRINDEALACRAFDLAVNCGTGTAVRLLQQAVNLLATSVTLEVDGRLGARTAAAINGYRHPKALLAALKYLAAQRYINLRQPRFLAGWLNRLEG